MPFSILTYYATTAVQNKNLFCRMNFVKNFLILRLFAGNSLLIYQFLEKTKLFT